MATVKKAKPGAVDVIGVSVTSPTRVVYTIDGTAVTKLDVARFFEKVAPLMLPHVRGRPISVVRCMAGSTGPAFFQKHPIKGQPAQIDSVEVVDKSGPTQCLTVHDAAGLVGLAQMNALEFHCWGSKEDDIETPDRLVCDLDPGEDVEWSDIVAAAQHVRQLLDDDGLESFVKTTGGKGLHVVAPLDVSDAKRSATWHDVHVFSEQLAAAMLEQSPDKYILNMKKALRAGKIFLDFGRNTRGATAIAPWSTRVRGANVAMPVAWDELDRVRGSTWNLLNVDERLRAVAAGKDPWRDYFGLRQRLPD